VENVGILVLTAFALHTDRAGMLEAVRARSFSRALVYVVSFAAAFKVLAIALSFLVTLVTLLRSEFGRVLQTCRFSALSLAVGSLPLLLVDQGKDIVRGVVDADTPVYVRACALGALFVWALGGWYWGRVLLMIRFEEPLTGAEAARERRFVLWVPRALGTASLAIAALAFVAAMPGAREKTGLALHAVLIAGLAVVFHVLVTRRRRWFALDPEPHPTTLSAVPPRSATPSIADPVLARLDSACAAWRALPPGTRHAVQASAAASAALFVAFTAFPVAFGQRVGSMFILYVAAANAVFFGSAAVLLGRVWKLPLVTLAFACAAVFSYWNDNHAIRLAGGGPSDRRPLLRAAFDEWLESRRKTWTSSAPLPVIVVAAEGGGLRAAYWTAAVLSRLQDEEPRFARHVFAISGVSGGSLGSAVFAALVAEQGTGRAMTCPEVEPLDPAGEQNTKMGVLQRCADAALSRNFLAPVLAKMVAPDLLQWFLPFPVHALDRATALEDAWEASFRETTDSRRFAAPFQELWQGPRGNVPALLLNSTHVETGRRVVHSHLRFGVEDIPDAHDFAVVMHTDIPWEADVPLATAAHDSARFTYVSPAGLMRAADARERGHVVDGGYFENSGAETAFDLIRILRSRCDENTSVRFIVLYIGNDPARSYGQARAEVGSIPAPPTASSLGELFAPVRALLGTRTARGSLALEHLQTEVADHDFVDIDVCPTTNKEQLPLLALGWQRSRQAREFLSDELDKSCKEGVGRPISNHDRLACLEAIVAGKSDAELPGACPGAAAANP
jgi:hypothetical protein